MIAKILEQYPNLKTGLIVGGPPCQGFSGLSMKGTGLAGKSGDGVTQFAALVKKMKYDPWGKGSWPTDGPETGGQFFLEHLMSGKHQRNRANHGWLLSPSLVCKKRGADPNRSRTKLYQIPSRIHFQVMSAV